MRLDFQPQSDLKWENWLLLFANSQYWFPPPFQMVVACRQSAVYDTKP